MKSDYLRKKMEDNIKMKLEEVDCENVSEIKLAQVQSNSNSS